MNLTTVSELLSTKNREYEIAHSRLLRSLNLDREETTLRSYLTLVKNDVTEWIRLTSMDNTKPKTALLFLLERSVDARADIGESECDELAEMVRREWKRLRKLWLVEKRAGASSLSSGIETGSRDVDMVEDATAVSIGNSLEIMTARNQVLRSVINVLKGVIEDVTCPNATDTEKLQMVVKGMFSLIDSGRDDIARDDIACDDIACDVTSPIVVNNFRSFALSEGVSESSISNYLNRLSTLETSVFPELSLDIIVLGGRSVVKKSSAKKSLVVSSSPKSSSFTTVDDIDAAYDVLRVRYSNMSTRRNFLTAILAFLRYTPSLRDDPRAASARARWTEFHGHARAFQESRYKQHMPSERQLEKYVGLDQIDSKYQELKGGDVTNTTLQDSLDILLLSFVISMPPKRADMGALRIYEDTDPRLSSENYLVLRRASSASSVNATAYIVLNKYKTSASYGRVETDLPHSATADLLDSLRHWPRDYVFVTRRGHNRPFASNNAYGRWVQSVFSRLFGRATGVTMLRHIFITEKVNPGSMNDDELEDIARQMLHSTDLQRKYNWDRAKICETLSQMCEQCTGGYQFTNSAVGDLLIHGINGGPSQKILVGTQSNNYALVSFEQTEVTVRDAKLSMMNDSGGVQLSAEGDVMYTTGSIIPASTCNVTFGSDASRWESMYVKNFTMSGKAQLGSNVSMSNATGKANIWSSGTYLGVNTPNPTQELDVNGSMNVSSNVTIRETLDVGLSTTLQDTLMVTGAATLSNSLTVDGATTLDNTLLVTGASTLSNSLTVDGVTTLDNTLLVNGAATLSNSLTVDGATTLDNTLMVTGASTLSNSLTVDGVTTLDNTLMVTGAATLSNSLTVDGATILDDTLLVMGASTFSNEVSFANSSTFLSNVIVLGQLSVDTVTYNVSNIVVFASEELRSNLLVEGVMDVRSNVFLGGKTLIGDELTVDSNVFIQGVTTMSNDLIVTGNTFFLSGGAQTFEGAVIIKDTLDVYSNLVAKSGLQVDGVASFSNDVYVSSNFAVQGVTTFGDALEVTGASTLSNTLIVDRATILDNTLFVTGASTLSNSVDVYGPASLRNDLFVAGASTLSNTLTVDGATILDNSLFVTGASTLSNTLIVDGATILDNSMLVTGASTLSNSLTVDGATILDNTLFVTGESTLSNSVDVYGPASLQNDLLVMGTSTLSNTLTVDGATILDNSLFVTGASTLSNTLIVSGAATVDNSLLVIGASTLSNTLTVDGATVLDNSLFVTGASTFSNTMAVTSSASFLSNVTILGELSVDSITYNLSNIVIYSSEEIRSNLLVEGILDVRSNFRVEGTSMLSNELHLFSSATLYNGESTVTLSNLGGSATLSASSNNFGINMFPTSNAEYTVDINGDINFSGKIYQNGAVFSGWNSNQWGNYINSNAAFSGPSTATDALLVYQSNNLAFSLSNPSGLVSMYTSNKFVGMGTSNPSHELDVVGSVRATDGVYVNSNESFFRGVRSDCVAGVAGASVFRGDVWASSTTYTTGTGILNKVQLLGSGAIVDNLALEKSVPGTSNRNLPLAWDEFITCAGGDVVAQNLFTTGSSMVDGSLSVIGSLTGNSAVLKSVVISGGHSNFHTDAGSISSNTTTVLSGTLPMASSNVALGSVLFEVNGDTALNSSLALRSNAFVGGALFVGSNMNSNAPSLPNALAPEFSNVHLDVQGDVVIEDGLFVRRTAAFDGRVGVGIHEPGYPVDVQSSVEGVSMNCSAKVIASEFVVFSDARIKTGIEAYVADDLIERLSVKRFEYVDTVEHPGSMVGFIAQEVESVAPECVSTTSSFVTDIYSSLPIVSRDDRECVVSISNVSLSAETNARIVDDAVLKCRAQGGETFFVTVLHREGDLVTVLSSIAMPGIEDEDVLFVLGTRVDDFKMVRTDQINAIAVATLQSQNKRIGALESEVRALVESLKK
eukprot:gene2253-biopygen10764